MSALKPDALRLRFHEYYMPTEKILSWQPLSYPVFSFYFIPLLQRLVPDLLVMGRRREKFYYLLRLCFPPAAWLRYYYQIAGHKLVAPHYLLHPAKLIYHYAIELAGSARRLLAASFRRRARATR
jgi:hypothetical protein